MEKEFPYPEFMDRELMVPALLERLEGDDENLAAKFQWAGRALLKSGNSTQVLRASGCFGCPSSRGGEGLEGKDFPPLG